LECADEFALSKRRHVTAFQAEIANPQGDEVRCDMSTFPKSPREMTKGVIYFPRMLDKIRMHARSELPEEYHKNLGASRGADGACCNFLRVHHRDLRQRVIQGGTDEEILEWCFEKGRRPNEGDIAMWYSFASKLGWRDFATPTLEEAKKKAGVSDRDDIVTIPDFIDFDEGRRK
jgi:gluconokinase